MKIETIEVKTLAEIAREMFEKQGGYSNKTVKALDEEIQESLIGVPYVVAAEAWNLIEPASKEHLRGSHPKHLLWTLVQLKCYCIEPVATRLVGGVDSKTFAKWTNIFRAELSALLPNIILWEKRLKNYNGRDVCTVSVDCLDCTTKEQYPFNTGAYSEKFNGPALKYEVAVSIRNADIVWINGPFLAGKGDLEIFREQGLKDALCDDECVEADSGYRGDEKVKNPEVAENRIQRKQKSVVRGRHENVNSYFKKFSCLDDVFRHPIEKHQSFFNSVAVLTQLRFELVCPLYEVEYTVEYNF